MLTISARTAYAAGEVMSGAGHGFNRLIRPASYVYAANLRMALVAGLIVLIPGMPLLFITLNANLLAIVLMPPALVFLLIMANDPELMGSRVNSLFTNVAGISVAVMVAAVGGGYAVVAFVNSLSAKGG